MVIKKEEEAGVHRSRSPPAIRRPPRPPLTEEEQHRFLDMAISALLIARQWTRENMAAGKQAGRQSAIPMRERTRAHNSIHATCSK
jgi:hypothetical protein